MEGQETLKNPPESSDNHLPATTTTTTEEVEEDINTALDLTSYQLHDLDSVELPPTLVELDLTANRLSQLDPRITLLSHLKKLSLRQNLFDDAGIDSLSSSHAISGLEVNLLPFSPFFCENRLFFVDQVIQFVICRFYFEYPLLSDKKFVDHVLQSEFMWIISFVYHFFF